ncbi:Hydroxymethylglutaryl-CoA lyase YngG [compost metagenome]
MPLRLPEKVRIVEVSPRDGLQNEKTFVSTGDKITLIDSLSETGLSHLEVSSFVNPRWIPPLADAQEVFQGIRRKPGIVYSALIPNLKGYERAIEAGIDEAVIFMSSSETHSRKNINKSIDETLPVLREVAEEAIADGKTVRAYISTVFGCPYEGPVDPKRVVEIIRELLDMGVREISLGDTVGLANPQQVTRFVERLAPDFDLGVFALHFHDTRGTALANVLAGLMAGITTFDSSLGGLGGCPYAPGATGNVATEDLVYMLEEMGVSTGLDLNRLVETSRFMQGVLGRELPSRYLKSRLSACEV